MQVLIFANGEAKPGSMVDQAIQRLHSPHVLCADGGALHARKFGLKPHTIIGDLDSLTAPQVEQFAADGTEILRFPTQKDETDLELALSWCLEKQVSEIVIIGALGGRIDQTLANIILLALPELRRIPIEIVDGDTSLRLLRPGSHDICGRTGDTISLIPLADSVRGIITTNLEYPLRGETLPLGPARGISNVMSQRPRDNRIRQRTAAADSYSRTRPVTAFTVIKRDARGNDVLSYQGILIERGETHVCIEARFALDDIDLGYIHLRRGDRFREWFYSDRYFNIFRVQDVHSHQLKGWYCNITRPAIIEDAQVAAEDLELDVFVYPDGRALVLDQEEFAALCLSEFEQARAWEAVQTIREMVRERQSPFGDIKTAPD